MPSQALRTNELFSQPLRRVCCACVAFRYSFWSHEFTRCAPDIERLFKSVANSCMGPMKGDGAQQGTPAAGAQAAGAAAEEAGAAASAGAVAMAK